MAINVRKLAARKERENKKKRSCQKLTGSLELQAGASYTMPNGISNLWHGVKQVTCDVCDQIIKADSSSMHILHGTRPMCRGCGHDGLVLSTEQQVLLSLVIDLTVGNAPFHKKDEGTNDDARQKMWL